MKKLTFYFKVGPETHKVKAVTAGDAMQWMNRQVMDALNIGPYGWMDTNQPNTYYCALGNYWD